MEKLDMEKLQNLAILKKRAEITSNALLKKIEELLVNNIGGKPSYYQVLFSTKCPIILFIENTKIISYKIVRDIILAALPLVNLSERQNNLNAEDVIFIDSGVCITISIFDPQEVMVSLELS